MKYGFLLFSLMRVHDGLHKQGTGCRRHPHPVSRPEHVLILTREKQYCFAFPSRERVRGISANIVLLLLLLTLVAFIGGCVLMQAGTPEVSEEDKLFQQIMTSFESRTYESCIIACQQFLELYPESPGKDPVMIKLGEAFEGLLEQNYHQLIKEGMDEPGARAVFLARYGKYNCWETRDGLLIYDKEIYRQLLKKIPVSRYADEAAYHLIVWDRDYQGDPARIEREIKDLQEVITLYPTTTLSSKILFQMGYRFHLLADLYRFSPDPRTRDEAKAGHSLEQAQYLYKLCMNTSGEAEYSKKAFEYLEMIKKGERIPIQ